MYLLLSPPAFIFIYLFDIYFHLTTYFYIYIFLLVYRMNSTCLQTLIVVNITGVFPNFTSILDGLTTFNLTDIAQTIDDTFSTISDNVTDALNSNLGGKQKNSPFFLLLIASLFFDQPVSPPYSCLGITGTVNGFLNSTQSTVNNTLGSVMGSIVNTVKNVHDVIAQYSDQYIVPINYKRYAIMAALFALSMLAVVFCLLGFFLKKSGIMTW